MLSLIWAALENLHSDAQEPVELGGDEQINISDWKEGVEDLAGKTEKDPLLPGMDGPQLNHRSLEQRRSSLAQRSGQRASAVEATMASTYQDFSHAGERVRRKGHTADGRGGSW